MILWWPKLWLSRQRSRFECSIFEPSHLHQPDDLIRRTDRKEQWLGQDAERLCPPDAARQIWQMCCLLWGECLKWPSEPSTFLVDLLENFVSCVPELCHTKLWWSPANQKTNSVNILNILFDAQVSVSYVIVVCGFKLNNKNILCCILLQTR